MRSSRRSRSGRPSGRTWCSPSSRSGCRTTTPSSASSFRAGVAGTCRPSSPGSSSRAAPRGPSHAGLAGTTPPGSWSRCIQGVAGGRRLAVSRSSSGHDLVRRASSDTSRPTPGAYERILGAPAGVVAHRRPSHPARSGSTDASPPGTEGASMTAIIQTEKLTKSYGTHRGIIDVDLAGRRGRGLRLPRAQRRRQDDDDPDAPRPHPADERAGARLRHRVERRPGRHPPPRRLHPGRVHALRPAHRRPDARVLREPARRRRPGLPGAR